MMFRRYYSLYYDNEEIKSVEIGNMTLRIIENMIKESYNGTYSFDDVISNTLSIIKSSSMSYDVDKWLKFLASNVYENIISLGKDKEYSPEFIDIIKKDEINTNSNDEILKFTVLEFYKYNHDLYSIDLLKELRQNIPKENKVLLKKINPFYDEIEK